MFALLLAVLTSIPQMSNPVKINFSRNANISPFTWTINNNSKSIINNTFVSLALNLKKALTFRCCLFDLTLMNRSQFLNKSKSCFKLLSNQRWQRLLGAFKCLQKFKCPRDFKLSSQSPTLGSPGEPQGTLGMVEFQIHHRQTIDIRTCRAASSKLKNWLGGQQEQGCHTWSWRKLSTTYNFLEVGGAK